MSQPTLLILRGRGFFEGLTKQVELKRIEGDRVITIARVDNIPLRQDYRLSNGEPFDLEGYKMFHSWTIDLSTLPPTLLEESQNLLKKRERRQSRRAKRRATRKREGSDKHSNTKTLPVYIEIAKVPTGIYDSAKEARKALRAKNLTVRSATKSTLIYNGVKHEKWEL